ncbi:MAG: PIN domain-containing protein [Candidatus Lokiarchaeota archaeon]|nr:PIN domain-containing protein [Candidatus Lokiarchaeota archaeon]
MRHKRKLYLDTSVVSAVFDDRNPERKYLTESFFEVKDTFEVYISNITLLEIDKTPDNNLKKLMKESVKKFTVLSVSDDVEELAREVIEKGAINESYSEDAYHIALAIINDMDFLLSWNFRHIVRKKTKDIVRMICSLKNLRQIEILTPAELL